MRRRWSIDEIRALGVRTDLETGASIWGLGRTRAYELARAGEFPSPIVKVGANYIVLVLPLLAALGATESEQIDAGPSTEPAPATTSSTQELSHDHADPPGHIKSSNAHPIRA